MVIEARDGLDLLLVFVCIPFSAPQSFLTSIFIGWSFLRRPYHLRRTNISSTIQQLPRHFDFAVTRDGFTTARIHQWQLDR